jgi:hypothetical protein
MREFARSSIPVASTAISEAELESHLAMLAADNTRRGMSPEKAWREHPLPFSFVRVVSDGYLSAIGVPYVPVAPSRSLIRPQASPSFW